MNCSNAAIVLQTDMSATKQWVWAFLIVGIILFGGYRAYMALPDACDPQTADCGPTGDASREYSEYQDWQEYSKSYFSIRLPDTITETHVGKDEIDEAFSDYALYTSHNVTNLIGIEEISFLPGMSPRDVDAFVTERADLIENAPGVDISYQSDDNFKGSPARRYDFYLPESQQFTKALLVFKEGVNGLPDRYYTLSEMSVDGNYDEEDFEILLDSFELK